MKNQVILIIIVWHFDFKDVDPSSDKDWWDYDGKAIDYLQLGGFKYKGQNCLCICPNINDRKALIDFCKYVYTGYSDENISGFYIFLHSDYVEFTQSGAHEVETSVKALLPRELYGAYSLTLFGKTEGRDSDIYKIIDSIRKSFNIYKKEK